MLLRPINSRCVTLVIPSPQTLTNTNALLSLLRLILGLAFFNCAFKKQFFFFFATHFGPSLIVFCFLLLFLFFNNITFNFFIIIIFLLSVTHLHKSKNYIF